MRILLFGDENFSFCNGFLEDHEDDIVEVCSCLKENELKQESKNNIQSLNKNVVIHYGINPVQLKSKFPPNTFDALYYVLPGLSFHGYPEFIDPQTEMFKLRLNLFCFSFLKSSKNIIKPDGYVYLLFPEENQLNESVVVNNNENNDNVSSAGGVVADVGNSKKSSLPFLPIEPKKLARFCNIIREESKDYKLNLSVHSSWLPVLFNMPIVNEIPEWLKTCKYYCFKMTELDNNKNKTLKGNNQLADQNNNNNNNAATDANSNNNNNNNNNNNGTTNEEDDDIKRQQQDDEDQAQAQQEQQEKEEQEKQQQKQQQTNDENNGNNNNNNNNNEESKEKVDEDPDEYNVLKIPPQVFDYPIEKLGHVNECFLFKLYSINSKSILISRLTLKYDPRISGWKGDNKMKKDMMNNMNNMNMMKNMNNLMNMNKFKAGKYMKNKGSKNDFQQQYKNNLMQNNMNFALNKKGNMNLPPPPPNNLGMQPNNVTMANQNMNYKQNNFPFVNNYKNMPNNLTQNLQNSMTNIPMNVNPNIPNNMMNPYMNGAYNNNFRNNMYQQNIPLPPPINNFNKKIYQGHNINMKTNNDIYNTENMDKNYDNYNMKDNCKSDNDNNMNNTNMYSDDYEFEQTEYNSINAINNHINNSEDPDYYFLKQRSREAHQYGTY
ncbi:hypothetical protein PFNF135_02189 [Plasmodium falciparum NF135/5.C10]|uniref:Uncharacterized protein n=1 Tax=Plasmodium falciparum NF135/5.C10 TaxID=1036726 RepID=W4IHX8_PLAFA|nr:hypothetical protein PFNF135_02189 [Plasmodium falciparum NF135/5.C10]